MSKSKNNPANLFVRECMATALIQLLKEKPLSAVSVSELTKRAGVSRMAYYRNYQSKEDIFSSYLMDIVNDYRRDAKLLSSHGDYSDMEHLIHCFTYFEKHQNFLSVLFQSGLSHIFLSTVSNYITETWQKPEDGIEHFYTLQAFAGSLYNVYLTWSVTGAKETPEEMARILHEIYRN